MKTLKVGMVGYGMMGKMHTYAYKSIPMIYDPAPAKIELTGVAVRSQASRQLATEQAEYKYSTENWTELIEDEEIDIINCCTPNNLHRAVCIAAIEAGKHLYIDKPLAGSLADAEAIMQAANKADAAGLVRTRQMVHNYRFAPALIRAKQLMDEGRLGRIFTFNFRYIHNSNIDATKPLPWKTDRAQGAGVFVDIGSHIVDLAHWLLGDFTRVLSHPFTQIRERPDGRGGMAAVNGDDACYVMVETAGGAVGLLEASKLATGANDELTFEIRGDKGAMTFNLMDPNWLHFFDNTVAEGAYGGERGFTKIECVQRYPKPAAFPGPKLSVGWMRFHIHCLHEFIAAIAEGRPGSPSLEDGIYVQKILETCYEEPGRWADV